MVVMLLWLGCVVYVLLPIACIAYIVFDENTNTTRAWVGVCLILFWLINSVITIKHSFISFFS